MSLGQKSRKSTVPTGPTSSTTLSSSSSSSSVPVTLQASSSGSAVSGSDKVRVVVRIRPFVGEEERTSCTTIVDKQFLELTPWSEKATELVRYKFDACHDVDSTQDQIFQEIAPSMAAVFRGINTTVFAYGITGAGKTHTMQGTSDQPGIIPRTFEHLMTLRDQLSSRPQSLLPPSYTQTSSPDDLVEASCSMLVSYLEIYNEKVFDLLEVGDDLPIREDSTSGQKKIFIPGLAEVGVKSLQEFQTVYDRGCLNRTVAKTSLNSTSSRSHAILIIKINVTVSQYSNMSGRMQLKSQRVLGSKLHLIDLAGSEDNRHTDNKGVRLTESTNINTSLFVLGKVVNALNEGAARVPYRDSKLTRLLQDSLGGGSKGVMVANIAPGKAHFMETQRTLNFASKSRKICNRPLIHQTISSFTPVPPPVPPEDKRPRSFFPSGMKNGRLPVISSAKNSSVSQNKENVKASVRPGVERSSDSPSEVNGSKTGKKRLRRSPLSQTDPNVESDEDWDPNAFVDSFDTETFEEDPQEEELQPAKKKAKRTAGRKKNSEGLLAPLIVSCLSPNTKRKTASELLSRAQTQESLLNFQEALTMYLNAQQLQPEETTLAKISEIRNLLEGKDIEEEASPVKELSAMDSERIARNLEQILRILNTGEKKDLRRLHLIGEKRADLIIQQRDARMVPIRSLDELQHFGLKDKSLQKFVQENVIDRVDW